LAKKKQLGKMLVLAAVLGCLDPVATAVAALSSKSPFSASAGRAGADAADAARRALRQPQSDFFTAVAAFDAMEAFGRASSGSSRSAQAAPNGGLSWGGERDSSSSGGSFGSGSRAATTVAREKLFCERHFLSYSAMVEIRDLRRGFGELLAAAGLTESGSNGHGGGSDSAPGASVAASRPLEALLGGAAANKHRLNRNLVAAVLAAGLYPHLAVSRGSASAATGAAPLEWRCGRRGDGVASAAEAGDAAGAGAAPGAQAAGGATSGQAEGERVEVHRDSVNYGARSLTTK
jgi:hypothetical protein